MCGIVGYTGRKQAYPVLSKGLKKLEYRGYDSAGVALHTGNHLAVYKKQGMVAALEAFAGDSPVRSTTGIGHTRWRSEEHTSELQSLMRISYAVFCLMNTRRTKKHTS